MSEEINHLKYLYDRMRQHYFNALRTDFTKKQRLANVEMWKETRHELIGALDVLGLDDLMQASNYYPAIEKKAKRAVRSR
jgi:hypothetical protein